MTDLAIQTVKHFGWKPDLPDTRDLRVSMAFAAQVPIPPVCITDPAALPAIRDQSEQGSCVGYSVRTMGMITRRAEHQMEMELAPRFIYWNARRIEGTTSEDSGCQIRDAIKGVARWGFAAERVCAYNPKNWTNPPTVIAYSSARLDMAVEYRRLDTPGVDLLTNLKAAIVRSRSFAFGFAVYENFELPSVTRTGVMLPPQGSILGGHAVCAVGYSDLKGAFLIANSWGPNWGCAHPMLPKGSRGYFWFPYNLITNRDLCDDFWIVSKIT